MTVKVKLWQNILCRFLIMSKLGSQVRTLERLCVNRFNKVYNINNNKQGTHADINVFRWPLKQARTHTHGETFYHTIKHSKMIN